MTHNLTDKNHRKRSALENQSSPTTVGQIQPAPYNPRQISDAELEALKRSLHEFGDLSGIVVNVRTGHLAGGHQRIKTLDPSWRIVKRPVKDHVGTVAIGYIDTPDQGRLSYREVDWELKREKAANLAANKIQGEWDFTKLAPILQEFRGIPEFELTGFTPKEADTIINVHLNLEPREETANIGPVKSITRPGMMWALGQHRILCADATNSESWTQLMDDAIADLVITDPPYGVEYNLPSRMKSTDDPRARKDYKWWPRITGDKSTTTAMAALPLIFEHLNQEHGSAYIFAGSGLLVEIALWLKQQGIHRAPVFLVWDKETTVVTWSHYHNAHENIIWCGPGSRPAAQAYWFGPKNETTMWREKIDATVGRLHPTQKPTSLYERAILNSSRQGDTVVDCFAGSGTCLIAAEKLKRRCLSMELDPHYVDTAIKRWERFTGGRAQRIIKPATHENLTREISHSENSLG